MFDIGGWEFLVIMVIAIVVVGPKDLPAAIRNVSGWVRKARALAHEFQSGLHDIAREAEFDSVRREVGAGLGFEDGETIDGRVRRGVAQTVDPEGTVRGAFEDEDGLYDPLDDPDIDDPEAGERRRVRDVADRTGGDGGTEDDYVPPADNGDQPGDDDESGRSAELPPAQARDGRT